MNKHSDKVFEVYWNGRTQWVVANWYEARKFHLNSYCESCGLVFKSRGRYPSRLCLGDRCWSDAIRPLWQAWNDLPDGENELDAEEAEQLRISTVLR